MAQGTRAPRRTRPRTGTSRTGTARTVRRRRNDSARTPGDPSGRASPGTRATCGRRRDRAAACRRAAVEAARDGSTPRTSMLRTATKLSKATTVWTRRSSRMDRERTRRTGPQVTYGLVVQQAGSASIPSGRTSRPCSPRTAGNSGFVWGMGQQPAERGRPAVRGASGAVVRGRDAVGIAAARGGTWVSLSGRGSGSQT